MPDFLNPRARPVSAGHGDMSAVESLAHALAAALAQTFPRTVGSFTLTAAPTTMVAQPSVVANSFVALTPINPAAGTLQGSTNALHVASLSPGEGFTVATSQGESATGGEAFAYLLVNPG